MASIAGEQLYHRFSLAEIRLATGDFSSKNLIGEGGFGKVYKGRINDDGPVATTVAIKRLSSQAQQGETEFVAEMDVLTKFRHRNIVSLIGYCIEEKEMILVYEYMPNGTLADHLHKISRNNNSSSSLLWNQRLQICIGVGRGLDYLHSGCSIIHRDVKSTNILLDDNFTAKVSDFGLAKHLNIDVLQSHVSTIVKGSFGYLDPSYYTTGRLTKASDTYAFGVVLLEVLSGRPAVGQRLAVNEPCMTWWAQEKIQKRKPEQIVDPNLRSEIISLGCLKTFVGVAQKCLHQAPEKRLTMTRAVAQLELALEQQQRHTHKLQFRSFWNRVTPSGSRQKVHKEVEVDPTIQADHIVNMLPINKEAEFAIECLQYEAHLRPNMTTVVKDLQFASRVIPSGSTEKDENEVEVDELPNATPAIEDQEDVIEKKQSVDMQSIAVRADHIVNMLPIYVPAFPLAELEGVISLKNSIPYGSAGSVLHGVLKNGKHVAIKQLNQLPKSDFIAEVSRVSSLKHENVVQLVGYCLDGGLHLFLYEFAPRGSLHHILHDLKSGPAFSWAQRIKTAVEAAKGLQYIHEKMLIHCNIGSSNVLLFDDEIAKITNFHQSTDQFCDCKRAFLDGHHPSKLPPCYPYHPPGFVETGHSQEGDVYSFGILLLELLTGREGFGFRNYIIKLDVEDFVDTLKLSKNKVKCFVDAGLKGDYPSKAVAKVAKVAIECLQYEAYLRPNMTTVVKDLQLASASA